MEGVGRKENGGNDTRAMVLEGWGSLCKLLEGSGAGSRQSWSRCPLIALLAEVLTLLLSHV